MIRGGFLSEERVICPKCGVRKVATPWALAGSGLTLLFEAYVLALVTVGLLTAVLNAAIFISILWDVGGDLVVDVFGHVLTVPKYLVIAARGVFDGA